MTSAFAKRFDLTDTQVFDLMALRDSVGRINEKVMNRATPELEMILRKIKGRMIRKAITCGFEVSFDHGIYPVLVKDGVDVYLPE